MSHFPVLVIVKKDEVVANPLREREAEEFGGMTQYANQYISHKVDELLEPYIEYTENEELKKEYFERNLEINYLITDVLNFYQKGDTSSLCEKLIEERDRRVNFIKNHRIKSFDKEKNQWTDSELDDEMKSFDELYELFSSEKFMANTSKHMNMLIEELGASSEIEKTDEGWFDVYYSNPEARWDWYVFGGRWNSIGDNGYISDLKEVLQYEEVEFWQTLSFHKFPKPCLAENEKELEVWKKENLIDNSIIKSSDFDYETREHSNIVYYTKDELFEITSRKKLDFQSFLTDEEGWTDYGEMGWWGMSSLDLMEHDEREGFVKDTDKLINNMLEKYIEKGDYVGVVVDCRI